MGQIGKVTVSRRQCDAQRHATCSFSPTAHELHSFDDIHNFMYTVSIAMYIVSITAHRTSRKTKAIIFIGIWRHIHEINKEVGMCDGLKYPPKKYLSNTQDDDVQQPRAVSLAE